MSFDFTNLYWFSNFDWTTSLAESKKLTIKQDWDLK